MSEDVVTNQGTAGSAAAPLHDKDVAARFLATLDPAAREFTFQFFHDGPTQGRAEVFHGSLDDVWPKVLALNTPARGVGVFVTISETDGRGRRRENIVRARALFIDADNAEQVTRCSEIVLKCRATPTMMVQTSAEHWHLYYCTEDIPRDEFSAYQTAMIEKFGTDPAVKDLSRVMRLPGTLHLKDPSAPRNVTLKIPSCPPTRWNVGALVSTLGLPVGAARNRAVTAQVTRSAPTAATLPAAFTRDEAERVKRKFGHLPADDSASAGILTNVEEIRSAVSAIPPASIAAESDWMKLARGLAHEARIHKDQAEDLWHILDGASRAAPNYDQDDNHERWLRYIEEALNRDTPITIASVFALAKDHGWAGWSPPSAPNASSGIGPAASPTATLKVSFSNIPHRRWLYGVELLRGEITLLAAPGGVGKSSLAIGMSVSLATGSALLKEKIWEDELGALYLNGEDSRT
jgi:hypothetical protein